MWFLSNDTKDGSIVMLLVTVMIAVPNYCEANMLDQAGVRRITLTLNLTLTLPPAMPTCWSMRQKAEAVQQC